MLGPYTREKIENWASDFCHGDALNEFPDGLREVAGPIAATFLAAACEARGLEPDEIEESDVRTALLGPVARLSLTPAQRSAAPALCGALLAWLESEGRLAGGRVLGAFVRALGPGFEQAASGKGQPFVRPGSRIGRNDPCPCGSGRKYKKCCQGGG